MLLDDLIRTLSNQEVEALRKATFSPRRRDVLDMFLRHRDQPIPSTDTLTASLRLTRTNLYRQSSALLQECYAALAADELDTLRLLTRKFLYKHFREEVKRLEEIYTSRSDGEALARLYELAISSLFRFEVKTFDLEFARSLIRKYFSAKGSHDEQQAVYFEMRSILQEIVSLPARKRLTIADMERRATELLDAIEAKVHTHGDIRAKLFFNDSKQIIRDYVGWQPEERLSWLYKNRTLLQADREGKYRLFQEMNELRIAELEAYTGMSSQSLDTFKRYHPSIEDVISRGYLYVNAYIGIAIIARNDALAEEIATIAFDREPAEKNDALRVLGTTHKALLALLKRDLRGARKLIEAGLAENMEDNFFFLYDVQFRCDEVVLAFYEGNYELVHQLAERNKKWLRSRKYSINVSAWGYFLTILDELATKKMTSKPIKRSTLERFQKEFTSEWPQYARLVAAEVR